MAGRVIWLALVAACLASVTAGAQVLQYTENVNSPTQLALGYPVPQPIDTQTAFDGFRSYQSLFDLHQDLMLTNDEVGGASVGATLDGQPIWAYVIGDLDDTTFYTGQPEPAVLINGTIHAREWASPEVVTDLMETMVARKADGGLVQYLIENLNFVVVPVLNVDGFVQTQTFWDQVTPTPPGVPTTTNPPQFEEPRDGRMRRKNMRDVDQDLDTAGDRLLGIDLNRNNEVFFVGGSNSTDPESLVYRGAFAASEPESQALRQAATLAPETRLRLYIDAHSFSRVFFVPTTSNSRRNAITSQLANRMSAVTNNFMGSGHPAYFPVIAAPPPAVDASTTATFFTHTYEIPGWTLEIEPPCGFPNIPTCGAGYYGGNDVSHDGFILPESEIARARRELTATHLLGFYHQVGPPSVRAVQVIEDGTGAVVVDARWAVQQPATRALSVMQNGTLEEGVAYTLWIGFDKPMRHRNASGNVANYPGQVVTLAPSVTLAVTDVNGGSASFRVPFAVQDWLDNPGGAPSGYDRYTDDAIARSFTIPTSLQLGTTPTQATLRISAIDLAGLALDADPATTVDFANGAWTGYENTAGVAGDVGGTDDTITLQASGTAVPAPGGGGGGGTTSGGGGGGGGAPSLFLLVGLSMLARCRWSGRHAFS